MMMFSFWDKPDRTPIAASIENWRSYFPGFQILGDPDIEGMITEYFPRYIDLYRRIGIPTCKSDIAILVSLYARGGLYVDIHCGVRNAEAVSRMIADSENWELILYNKDLRKEIRPAGVLRPLNSVIAAKPNSPIMLASAEMAFRNLERHWQAERENPDYVSYDIWSLTGPGVLEHTICIPPAVQWGHPLGLRPENAGRVRFIQEGPEAPIQRYLFHTYNPPGTHWSIRQKSERLFSSLPD